MFRNTNAASIEPDNSRLDALLNGLASGSNVYKKAFYSAYTAPNAAVGLTTTKGNMTYQITPAMNDFYYVRARSNGVFATGRSSKFLPFLEKE